MMHEEGWQTPWRQRSPDGQSKSIEHSGGGMQTWPGLHTRPIGQPVPPGQSVQGRQWLWTQRLPPQAASSMQLIDEIQLPAMKSHTVPFGHCELDSQLVEVGVLHTPASQICPSGQSEDCMHPLVLGTHIPATQASPVGQGWPKLQPPPNGRQKPSKQLSPMGQSDELLHCPPLMLPGMQIPKTHCPPFGQSVDDMHWPKPPVGKQKPKRQELPGGQSMPPPHCAIGGMQSGKPSRLPQHWSF